MIEEQAIKKKEHPKAQVQLEHVALTLTPDTIQAIKYNDVMELLLVARQNGTIDLYNNKCFSILESYAYLPNPIRSIFWLPSNDHFIAFYLAGSIALFSIKSPYPKTTYQLQPGINIFQAAEYNGEFFSIACSDSSLRIIKIQEYSIYLLYQSQLYEKSQCISTIISQDYIISGYSDGIIRCFNHKMNLQASFDINPSSNQSNAPIPWTLSTLHRYLLIGTSLGQVHIYETRFFTEIIKLQTHQASLLCSLTSGNSIYFSGSDSKVVKLEYLNDSFIIQSEKRGQSHEVLALEMVNGRVVSGGINTDLCFYNDNNFFRVWGINERNIHFSDFKLGAIQSGNKLSLITIDDLGVLLTIAEVEAKGVIHTLALTENYLFYSHFSQGFLFRIVKENGRFQTLEKLCSTLSAVQSVFYQNDLYFITNKFVLKKINLQTLKEITILKQLELSKPQLFMVYKKQLIMGSLIEEKFVSFSLDTLELLEEVNCKLPSDHKLINFFVTQGVSLNIIAVYNNNRFGVYVQSSMNGEKATWRLSSYSRQFMYKLPMELLELKQCLKGVIFDGKDEKRLLFYTNNHLIKAHQRGKPPSNSFTANLQQLSKPLIEKKKSSQIVKEEATIDENFSIVKVENVIVKAIPLSKNCYALLEWDKQSSFANLPDPFNAKTYKK